MKFRTDNRQTKDEFRSQFSDTSEEIIVKVWWAWSKGSFGFTAFGKEELVHVRYSQPWEADEEHPAGTSGSIYWFSRKKLLGYPYSPRLITGECYRLKVRRCILQDNAYLLEEVLESDLDISGDDDIYEKTYQRYMNQLTDETRDVLIYCVNSVDVSKAKRAEGMAVGYAYVEYSAVIDGEEGKPKMVGRTMTIPFDDRNFAKNKTLRFKAGSNYKVRAKIYKRNSSLIAFDQLLEADVRNEALKEAGKEALKPVKWPVEGFDYFYITWDKIEMKASCEDVIWDSSSGPAEISIYLECDPDNCHTAYRSTEYFLQIYKDRDLFEKKVFEAAADSLLNENGMIETWDDDAGTITKEEFIRRISLSFLSFETEGIDIMLDLDDLFSDHGYSLYMNKDGSIAVNGLWG